jgi:hypothetical protein
MSYLAEVLGSLSQKVLSLQQRTLTSIFRSSVYIDRVLYNNKLRSLNHIYLPGGTEYAPMDWDWKLRNEVAWISRNIHRQVLEQIQANRYAQGIFFAKV